MPIYEIVAGGFGSGKSTFALRQSNPFCSHKLGNGHPFIEVLILKWGSIQRHQKETARMGFTYTDTTLARAVRDIQNVRKSTLIIDEWTHFSFYTLFMSESQTLKKIHELLLAIDQNPHIERVVFVCMNQVSYSPFNLYKKKALWNKAVYARAKKITRLEFGVSL